MSEPVFTLEKGKWSAHLPDVPGAYGLGPTPEAAEADLRMALELLVEYEASERRKKLIGGVEEDRDLLRKPSE
jgi:predicted RNase H-like HicB family nuclease